MPNLAKLIMDLETCALSFLASVYPKVYDATHGIHNLHKDMYQKWMIFKW